MIRRRRVLWILGFALVGTLLLVNTQGPMARVMAFWPAIRFMSEKAGMDPYLLAALVHVESGGDPNVGTPGGAIGLLQLTPAAAMDANRGRKVDSEELKQPETALRLGARYLALMRTRFGDDRLALAAFRLGPTRISREIDEAGGAKAFLDQFEEHPAWLYVTKVEKLKALYQWHLGPAQK